MTYPETEQLQAILQDAKHILIVQADNPDADSLASALALEQLLGNSDKEISMYCAVDMPTYLRYMQGWDRVQKELPKNFDATIIVDASTMTLLEKFQDPHTKGTLAGRPCIVLDHHAITDHPIPFATTVINDGNRASTGELIYILSRDFGWSVDIVAGEFIMNSILGDTQGLSNDLASVETYRIMAELVELGVNRPKLEEIRREFGKMPESIFRYKAELIRRTEFYADGRVAIASVPQSEINQYSPLYNPAALIQNDMLQTTGVQIAIVLKSYDGGRITAAIRANTGYTIAGALAEHFGGGGHKYASGFKIVDGRAFDEVKSECIIKATHMLDNLSTES